MLIETNLPPDDALIGAIVRPGDAGWNDARASFNLLLDQHPAAVALPADAREVAAAVAYAHRAGLRVAPQGAAHNQGPLGDLGDTLLLTSASSRRSASTRGRSECGSAPGSSGTAWSRGSRPTVSPPSTVHRPTSASPDTRSAAAWAGSPASTGCRPTP